MRARWLAGIAVFWLAGCNPPAAPTAGGGEAVTGPLRFWHTQTQDNATALDQIVKEFNDAHPEGPPLEATYIGNYDQLYEKIRASAAVERNRVLPDLAVAYESMIADYMAADIVRPLDDLLTDSSVGLDKASLDDIFPSYLATNRFPQFGGLLLSFPFTKSNLMLYYNADMLREVGLEPPRTWDDFLAACRAIKAKRKITPVAHTVDASFLDGLVMSFGGKLISADAGDALFDQPAASNALEVLRTLFKEQLAYQVIEKGDENNDFANQKCAFFFRSSTARPFLQRLITDKFQWGMSGLPTGPGVEPMTVMFGANICVFRSTPERERLAWQFIAYFTSTAVTARWAQVTGYLPVRKSAAETEELKSFFAGSPQNRVAFDLLPVAVTEPNVAGWQNVRKCLEDAETTVASYTDRPAAEVAAELNRCADEALQQAKAAK